MAGTVPADRQRHHGGAAPGRRRGARPEARLSPCRSGCRRPDRRTAYE